MHSRFEWIKETLLCAVESQLSDLANVDAGELGEVIDMIKDLEEANYYCTVVKAMEEGVEEQDESRMYYSTKGKIKRGPVYGPEGHKPIEMREMEWEYEGEGHGRPYEEKREGAWRHEPGAAHTDAREGRSYVSRKMYMEAKEIHKDKAMQMKELEKYVQELAQDMIEMVEGASPEEKQYLSKKVTALANKIIQIND